MYLAITVHFNHNKQEMRRVKVKCIDTPCAYDITIGREYWGDESVDGYWIRNDKEVLTWYPMRLFTLIMRVD